MNKIMKNVKNELLKGLTVKEKLMILAVAILVGVGTIGFYGFIIKMIWNFIF